MRDRLEKLQARYDDLEQKIADPEVMANRGKWQEYLKEHGQLRAVVDDWQRYLSLESELEEARAMLEEDLEPETSDWIQEESERLTAKMKELERRLRLALIPPDPRDDKNVIMEIRAGAGGGEAALFAADLQRMYLRYAETQGWKVEELGVSSTDIGGIREAMLAISGDRVFRRLKLESGVHRVQRIPVTESGGRIHTSTATVAVLPEAEEVEVEIDPDDLQVDTFTASGPGGQHVNKTASAVRITHKPTGVVVSCQDEKSQHRNKAKAMKVLRARLLDIFEREQASEIAEERRSQVGTGDRSERIRTYNFPQNRITDHRIGLTLHQLDLILEGHLDELLDLVLEKLGSDQAEEITSHGGSED